MKCVTFIDECLIEYNETLSKLPKTFDLFRVLLGIGEESNWFGSIKANVDCFLLSKRELAQDILRASFILFSALFDGGCIIPMKKRVP